MLPGVTSDLGFEAGIIPPYTGGSLDTQTVTVGADGTTINGNKRRGFIIGALGSCATGNSALYANAVIRELASEEDDTQYTAFNTIFTVTGVVANSGWTTMNVGGTTSLARASATFSTAGGNSTWTWFNTSNLFGSSGSTKTVGFS